MTAKRFHLVALGCPKARVEAETTLAALLARGARPVDDPTRADVVVVHTCAFVEDARRESVDTLLELAAARRRGRRPRLVAVGCPSAACPSATAPDCSSCCRSSTRSSAATT